MRQCEKYEALLAHYAREELRPKQTERVATHVAQCVRCREEVAAYRRLAAHLNKLPEPILPEHALHGFAEAVMQQVGSEPAQSLVKRFEFIAPLLQPRWRYAWGAAAMMFLVLAIGLWYAPFEREHQAVQRLPQLLQARAWDKIYYGLLEKDTRAEFMQQPVPAQLLKTAITDLLKKGERDQRVRVGVQRLVGALTGRVAKPGEEFASPKIMGVVTARGYIPAARSPHEAHALLTQLQALPDNAEVTLAEIMHEKK